MKKVRAFSKKTCYNAKYNRRHAQFMISEVDSILLDCLSSTSESRVYVTEMKTKLTRVTKSALDIFNLPGETIFEIHQKWLKIVHPDDCKYVNNMYSSLVHGETKKINLEYRVQNKFGKFMTVRHQAMAVMNETGDVVSIVGNINAVRMRNRYDPVTSLKNAVEFQEALDRITKVPDEDYAIMIFGLDDFSTINKVYGYSFGNEVLKTFASSVLNSMGGSAELYRLEGDRFGITFRNGKKPDVRRCYSIIQKIAETPYSIGEKSVVFTVSAGALFYPAQGKTKDEIYKNLDNALGEAKSNGKNSIVYFTEELADKAYFSIRLLEALKTSITNDFENFRLFYQPLMDAATDRLYGCEALLRWSRPDFPQVGPGAFIPMLEEAGSMNDIGRFVMKTALTQLKEWQKINPDFTMNVNVSYLQFKDGSFKYFVVEELEHLGIRPSTLIVELTESCEITDLAGLKAEIDFLREHGILVALDDFGLGYSSLGILRELKADMVKLDHSFVSQIADSRLDKAIIENIVNICHSVDIAVCVEGIENKKIYDIVKQYCPDKLQGYYFSVPIPAEKFNDQFKEA